MGFKILFDVSPCEAAILRAAMRHTTNEAPGEDMAIYDTTALTYARSLEIKGFGTVSGSIASGGARFAPNQDATQWLRGEPLTEVETFILGYFAKIPLGDFAQHRDAWIGFPEFREAAHGLQVRGYGQYRAGAVDEVDPYFVISDAGKAHAQTLADATARSAA